MKCMPWFHSLGKIEVPQREKFLEECPATENYKKGF